MMTLMRGEFYLPSPGRASQSGSMNTTDTDAIDSQSSKKLGEEEIEDVEMHDDDEAGIKSENYEQEFESLVHYGNYDYRAHVEKFRAEEFEDHEMDDEVYYCPFKGSQGAGDFESHKMDEDDEFTEGKKVQEISRVMKWMMSLLRETKVQEISRVMKWTRM